MTLEPDRQLSWYKTAANRFGLNLFLAIALHVFLILAISFNLPKSVKPQHTLDITLAYNPSEQAPDDADFLAHNAKLGSGDSEEMLDPGVTEESLLENEDIREQAPTSQPIAEPIPESQPESTPPEPAPEAVTQPEPTPPSPTAPPAAEERKAPVVQQAPVQQQRQSEASSSPTSGPSGSLLARSMEIASRHAQPSNQHQSHSKPRVRRLTSSPSNMAHDDAIYLDNWRRRIESVGNMNYPEEARRNNLTGSLRLLVAILPDGSVAEINVLQSSGHAVLDNAAIRIVQMASPFQPFSNEMRRSTDRLEIIRTWKFENRASVN